MAKSKKKTRPQAMSTAQFVQMMGQRGEKRNGLRRRKMH